uniref:Uncharacterized protein n=1 Tax=Eutreptiella gymnastica TaxID=73025 RepID=A0A7S1N292_9EUGL|mmetsp:Transcript_108582/g.187783  ORF Transcript_108582/g.187783 Transcript_108582/m.187783 type:complete len:355 (+) Transcript_108582:80-1144(+)
MNPLHRILPRIVLHRLEIAAAKWAVQQVFGDSPAQQGCAKRRVYWQKRLRERHIVQTIFRGMPRDDPIFGNLKDWEKVKVLATYPIIHEFNLNLLAIFTEEFRVLHNESASCTHPLDSMASSVSILKHFAKCEDAKSLGYSDTQVYLEDWDKGFWVRKLREQHPHVFPVGILLICTELSEEEQRVLELVASLCDREVQYVDKHPVFDRLQEMREEQLGEEKGENKEEEDGADPKPGPPKPLKALANFLMQVSLVYLILSLLRKDTPPPAPPTAGPREPVRRASKDVHDNERAPPKVPRRVGEPLAGSQEAISAPLPASQAAYGPRKIQYVPADRRPALESASPAGSSGYTEGTW